MISKLEVALQELEETRYWIELLIEANVVSEKRTDSLTQELRELIAITVASVRTVKRRRTS